MTETLTWHNAAHQLPDDDTTVLVQSPLGSEPVWPGFHDENGWHHVECAITPIPVTAWAQMPTGPIGAKTSPELDDTELAQQIAAFMGLLEWFRGHDVRIHLAPTADGWNLKLSVPEKGAKK